MPCVPFSGNAIRPVARQRIHLLPLIDARTAHRSAPSPASAPGARASLCRFGRQPYVLYPPKSSFCPSNRLPRGAIALFSNARSSAASCPSLFRRLSFQSGLPPLIPCAANPLKQNGNRPVGRFPFSLFSIMPAAYASA